MWAGLLSSMGLGSSVVDDQGNGATENTKRAYFSVAFTHLLEGSDEPQRVPFDRILSESSTSSYDTENNEFTCTLPGPYFFTFSIHPEQGKGASVSLMKNGEGQVMVIAQRKKKTSNSVCSQSAILDLEQGDKVWLQLNSGIDYAIRSHPGEPLVTFTGILLK